MNYFIAGGPLEPIINKDIIIRRCELKLVLNHIANKDHYIPLCCARMTGKTTLMNQLKNELIKSNNGVVYIYLGHLNKLNEPNFYQEICKKIEQSIKECFDKNIIVKPNIQNVINPPSFLEFLNWIVINSSNCRRIVIMLDEVGGVPENISQSFWGGIRSIFHDKSSFRKIIFIFAGSLDMNNLATSKNSPLLNVCATPIALLDFSKDQIKELISDKFFKPSILTNAIFHWTSGHPYLTQKLCALINDNEDYKNQNIKNYSLFIQRLVEKYFLDQDDSNIIHLFNHLVNNKKYLKIIRKIFDGYKTRGSFRIRELGILGVLIRNDDGFYVIRNRIYREALSRYFEDSDEEEY